MGPPFHFPKRNKEREDDEDGLAFHALSWRLAPPKKKGNGWLLYRGNRVVGSSYTTQKNAKKTCLFPISFQKPTENLTNQPQQTNQPTKPTNPTNQPNPTKDASSLTAFDSPNFPELATVGTEVEG